MMTTTTTTTNIKKSSSQKNDDGSDVELYVKTNDGGVVVDVPLVDKHSAFDPDDDDDYDDDNDNNDDRKFKISIAVRQPQLDVFVTVVNVVCWTCFLIYVITFTPDGDECRDGGLTYSRSRLLVVVLLNWIAIVVKAIVMLNLICLSLRDYAATVTGRVRFERYDFDTVQQSKLTGMFMLRLIAWLFAICHLAAASVFLRMAEKSAAEQIETRKDPCASVYVIVVMLCFIVGLQSVQGVVACVKVCIRTCVGNRYDYERLKRRRLRQRQRRRLQQQRRRSTKYK
uniref:Membrane protein n=1 Tax=Silurid herpesvirus 2 TaxID=2978071 RepID=A0A977XTV9_9VIRU|nr:membrane protein [Silurid herpesvirus 2]